jgi:hypothetical protein
LLFRYADGSPNFHIGVRVLVVVKHILTTKMFWRSRMKRNYSPNLRRESIKSKKEMNQSHSGTHLTTYERRLHWEIEQY